MKKLLKYVKVREDLRKSRIKVPVGSMTYGGNQKFEYRWIGDMLEILYHGFWLSAESIDWDFFDITNYTNDDVLMRNGKRFPNGFRSWMETHHEVVTMISYVLDKWKGSDEDIEGSKCLELYSQGGSTEMYDYAEQLTDEFEALNEGRKWDGEFFDEVDSFFLLKDSI